MPRTSWTLYSYTPHSRDTARRRPLRLSTDSGMPSFDTSTVLVDDGDNRIQYSPGWSEDSGSGIVEVDSTRHEASQGGLTASSTFSGERTIAHGAHITLRILNVFAHRHTC